MSNNNKIKQFLYHVHLQLNLFTDLKSKEWSIKAANILRSFSSLHSGPQNSVLPLLHDYDSALQNIWHVVGVRCQSYLVDYKMSSVINCGLLRLKVIYYYVQYYLEKLRFVVYHQREQWNNILQKEFNISFFFLNFRRIVNNCPLKNKKDLYIRLSCMRLQPSGEKKKTGKKG